MELIMFQGSIVALVTPMNLDGSIDIGNFKNLLDFHIFQNLCERRSLLKLSQVYGSNDPQENQWKVFFLNIITSDA